MESLSELNVGDYIFLFFFGFTLSIIICGFSNMPYDFWEYIQRFIEILIIVMIVLILLYLVMKQNSYMNYSYLVQEKLYFIIFIIALGFGLFFMFDYILNNRRKATGFLVFLITIFILIMIMLMYLANSAITARYNLNTPNMETVNYMARFK